MKHETIPKKKKNGWIYTWTILTWFSKAPLVFPPGEWYKANHLVPRIFPS